MSQFVRVEHLNNPNHGQTSAARRGWQKVNQSQNFKSAKKLLYSLRFNHFVELRTHQKIMKPKESATSFLLYLYHQLGLKICDWSVEYQKMRKNLSIEFRVLHLTYFFN